ncbi:MAG TPA: hypothetical protein VGD07_03175 [Methylomirabilota bacterium]
MRLFRTAELLFWCALILVVVTVIVQGRLEQLRAMRAAVLLLALLLAGCVSATPPRTLATANIGPPPMGYESAIREVIGTKLRDPYTAVYTFQRPVRSWFFDESQIRWAVCGTVNAKNAFGGYVGAKPFVVFYTYDRIVSVSYDNNLDARQCAKWHAVGAYE